MRQGLVGVLIPVALLGQTALFGQAPVARPEFDVASIKPSAPDEFDRGGARTHIDGSQVGFKFLSLSTYISYAYRVKNYEISGPDWMASARFDITAKLPAGGSARDLSAMLQTLLEDRFQLKLHRESKELPVYGMVIEKEGLKMQESPPDAPAAAQNEARHGFNSAAVPTAGGVTVDLGSGGYYTFAGDKLEGRKMRVSSIVNVLSAFMDRPVVDLTNLQGKYDFVLELSPEDFRAMTDGHRGRRRSSAASDSDGRGCVGGFADQRPGKARAQTGTPQCTGGSAGDRSRGEGAQRQLGLPRRQICEARSQLLW